MSAPALSAAVLSQLFTDARTANGFLPQPISTDILRQIYDLAKMAPTAMNAQPARYVFLSTPAARERLIPFLMEGNRDKTRSAPVCVMVATDTQFYEHIPKIWHNPAARDMFAHNLDKAKATAERNSTLSGAYFIMAARALGLDCGPMSGFDAEAINKEFFPDGRYQVNFLINIGYADSSKTMTRQPRLSFEEVAQVL